MKVVIALLFIMASWPVGAVALCGKENLSIHAAVRPVMHGVREVPFTLRRVAIWERYFGDKLDKACIERMDVFSFTSRRGRSYVQISTNYDECDGGNVFGIVVGSGGVVVNAIEDGWYACPRAGSR